MVEDGKVMVFGTGSGLAVVGSEEPSDLLWLGELRLLEHHAA